MRTGRNRDNYLELAMYLNSLKEPSLYKPRKDKRKSFRFLCSRTFRNLFSIRVEIDSNKPEPGILHFKETSGVGGGDPMLILKTTSIRLFQKDVDELLSKINDEKFWMLKSTEDNEYIGCDGSDWIIEGVENGNYHFVERWSPEQGDVRNLGLCFIKLSQEKIDELY